MGWGLLKALHVLAVLFWVGGMAFAHFVLRPSLAVLEPPQRLKLMHAVLGRFFRAVAVAVAVVLASPDVSPYLSWKGSAGVFCWLQGHRGVNWFQ